MRLYTNLVTRTCPRARAIFFEHALICALPLFNILAPLRVGPALWQISNVDPEHCSMSLTEKAIANSDFSASSTNNGDVGVRPKAQSKSIVQ